MGVKLEGYDLALCAAASSLIEWWIANRPKGWSEDQHFANPTVNTNGKREEKMAKCARTLIIALEDARD